MNELQIAVLLYVAYRLCNFATYCVLKFGKTKNVTSAFVLDVCSLVLILGSVYSAMLGLGKLY